MEPSLREHEGQGFGAVLGPFLRRMFRGRRDHAPLRRARLQRALLFAGSAGQHRSVQRCLDRQPGRAPKAARGQRFGLHQAAGGPVHAQEHRAQSGERRTRRPDRFCEKDIMGSVQRQRRVQTAPRCQSGQVQRRQGPAGDFQFARPAAHPTVVPPVVLESRRRRARLPEIF